MRQSYHEDMLDFMRKFGTLPTVGPSRLPDPEMFLFRYNLIVEEAHELLDAYQAGDLVAYADALADLAYVTIGAAVSAALPFDDIWAEVQRANMDKEKSTGPDDPRGHRSSGFDVVKPEGWVEPDIAGVIARANVDRFLGLGRVSVAEAAKALGILLRTMAKPDPRHTVTKAASWDDRFMELAAHVAGWSKDPSTKVGAVLVGTCRRNIAVGYNGFPSGVVDTVARLEDRETRHALTQHAERNVLDNANFDVRGATMYTTFFPCSRCAASMVSKEIYRVVCPPPSDREPWASDSRWTRIMFEDAGIKLAEVEVDQG